jgi:hypothetical protein
MAGSVRIRGWSWNGSSTWTTRTVGLSRRGVGTTTGWVSQVQVVTVRHLGMFLPDPLDVPPELVDYLAEQLDIDDPSCVKRSVLSVVEIRWSGMMCWCRRRTRTTDSRAKSSPTACGCTTNLLNVKQGSWSAAMMSETVAGSLVYHLSPDGVDFEPACAPGHRRLRGMA